jgi:glycosyltransferase involved in cell wall biosynthesis
MRVVWLTNILPEDAALALGCKPSNYGGWMSALLKILLENDPALNICVLTSSDQERHYFDQKVEYHTFRWPNVFLWQGDLPKYVIDQFSNLVGIYKPDLFHIHGTENYFAKLVRTTSSSVPVLISLQGLINGYYPHYTGGLSRNELISRRGIFHRIITGNDLFRTQEQWRIEKKAIEDNSLMLGTAFTGRTEWDKGWLHAINPGAEYHHVEEVLRPVFYQRPRDGSKIVPYSIYCSAAGSYPLKGLHWLLRAVSILKRKYPRLTVRVADADRMLSPPCGLKQHLFDTDYAIYLRKLVDELGLKEIVISLPSLSPGAVADELGKAHIFCLPSLCENSPNSLCEAMMMGVPVVATAVGGVPSLIDDRMDGILCSPADPVSLALSITELFDHPDFAIRISKQARLKALRRHDPSAIAKTMLELYEKIIDHI